MVTPRPKLLHSEHKCTDPIEPEVHHNSSQLHQVNHFSMSESSTLPDVERSAISKTFMFATQTIKKKNRQQIQRGVTDTASSMTCKQHALLTAQNRNKNKNQQTASMTLTPTNPSTCVTNPSPKHSYISRESLRQRQRQTQT